MHARSAARQESAPAFLKRANLHPLIHVALTPQRHLVVATRDSEDAAGDAPANRPNRAAQREAHAKRDFVVESGGRRGGGGAHTHTHTCKLLCARRFERRVAHHDIWIDLETHSPARPAVQMITFLSCEHEAIISAAPSTVGAHATSRTQSVCRSSARPSVASSAQVLPLSSQFQILTRLSQPAVTSRMPLHAGAHETAFTPILCALIIVEVHCRGSTTSAARRRGERASRVRTWTAGVTV